MEPISKTEEKISFDAVKKGLVDALDKLESDQKNLYQGRGFNRDLKSLCIIGFLKKALFFNYVKSLYRST